MRKITLLGIAIILLLGGAVFADEVVSDVVAKVNDQPITSIDLDEKVENFPSYLRKKGRNIESQALDLLIREVLIDQILEKETAQISPKKVDDIIAKEMEAAGVTSEKQFEQLLRKERKITFNEYREQLLAQLKKDMLTQLKVSVQMPDDAAVERWYRANKGNLGYTFRVRIIVKDYNRNNVKDELRVSNLMKEADAMAAKNFAGAAEKYSDDPSSKNGGLLDWMRLDQIYQIDPYLANMVHNLQGSGQTYSGVFVGEKGYYLVKIEGKKPVKLEDIRDQVVRILYAQEAEKAFDRWIKLEIERATLIINLKNYQPER